MFSPFSYFAVEAGVAGVTLYLDLFIKIRERIISLSDRIRC